MKMAGRLTLGGALYLGIISTLPWVLVKTMGVPFYFGGTSVLIVVSVALDTMRRIEAQSYTNKISNSKCSRSIKWLSR